MVDNYPPNIAQLVSARQTARDVRDWTKSDELRDRLKELGWEVRDTKIGQRLKFMPRKNKTVATSSLPKFNIAASGQIEASSLKAAHKKMADYFTALADGKEVEPLSEGFVIVVHPEA